MVEQYEAIAWAGELIAPAKAVGHPRLAFLYVTASLCWLVGRIEEAVQFSDAGQTAMRSGRGEVPFGLEAMLSQPYLYIGQSERSVEWCRAQLARGRDTHALARASLLIALAVAGSPDEEVIAAADGLIDTAEATANPYVLSHALLAYGFAFRDTDPDRAREAMRRGVVIAHDSGNRFDETHLAGVLALLEAQHGDPLAALEYFTVAIRNHHEAGNAANLRPPLRFLAVFLDRLGHHEAAATIAGFASNPMTVFAIPGFGTAITHLRDVLGDRAYDSLARKGETMTTAEMATYAYDQIDQARTELEHPS